MVEKIEKNIKKVEKTSKAQELSKAKTFWLKFAYVAGLTAVTFLVVIGTQLLVWQIAVWVLPAGDYNGTILNSVLSLLSYALDAIILIYLPPKLIKKFEKPTREKLGITGLPTWTDLGLGPAGYIVSLIGSGVLTALFNLFSWFNADEAQELGYSLYMSGPERAIAFLMLAVVAPIMEELIFRGWFYGKLRVKVPKVVAILATSILFGAVHLQWNVGISVFSISVVCCLLREVTGTIYAGTLVHIINNAVAFFLVFVVNMV